MTTATHGPLFRMERFTWLLVALVVGFLAAALVSVLFLQDEVTAPSAEAYREDGTPEAVIHNGYVAYRLGDAAMLESLYTAEAWTELSESIKEDYRFGAAGSGDRMYGVRMGQPQIDADGAKVRMTQYETYPRGFLGIRTFTQTEVEVTLVQQAGEWKLVARLPYTW